MARAIFIIAVFAPSIGVPVSGSVAAIIFESATLGPTGVTRQQVFDDEVPATNISGAVFTGVRFQLTQPAFTTEIGGHFVAWASGTFFGTIVALDDENDFPDSGDLSTPDVLGATLLTFPVLSDEVFGDLNVSLSPGWYALAFGSGLFGATRNGVALRNNPDIGDPSYLAYQPGFGWRNLSSFFKNHRFVIKGVIVPEPSTLTLAFIGLLLAAPRLATRTRTRNQVSKRRFSCAFTTTHANR